MASMEVIAFGIDGGQVRREFDMDRIRVGGVVHATTVAGEVGVRSPFVWLMVYMKTAEPLLRLAVTYRNLPVGSTVKKLGIDNSSPGIKVDTEAGAVGVSTPVLWLIVNMETELSSLLAV